MKGRQLEGKGKKHQRIVFLVEEAESAFAEIGLLGKDAKSKFLIQLANMSRMARKVDMNLIFAFQSAKADLFDTSIRNNFQNQFFHGSEATVTKSFQLEYNLKNLPVGTVYYTPINALVEIPLIAEPQMNILSLNDLEGLSAFYKKRFPQLGDEDDEI